MLQYLAQDACMVMEDAVWLSHCSTSFDDDEAALAEYPRMRLGRTVQVQMNNPLIGEYICPPGGAQAAVRRQIMSAMTPDQSSDQLAWFYGSNGLDNWPRATTRRKTPMAHVFAPVPQASVAVARWR